MLCFLGGIALIIPRNDRVLLERLPDPPTGHIVLTDVQTLRWARVVAIGPQVYDLAVGDVVVLPGIAAEIPDFESYEQLLVRIADIGAKLS
jgi:hypothetical protein